jgi:hypothetical protein
MPVMDSEHEKVMPRFAARAEAAAKMASTMQATAGGDDDDAYKFPEPASGTSVAEGGTFEGGVNVASFITKIKAIDEKMASSRKEIRAAILGCEKVTTLKAMYDSLIGERERLNQLKRKKILQAKLDKQNRDLMVVDRMADNLRDRFSEIRKTQGALRENIQGTAQYLQSVMGSGGNLPNVDIRTPLAGDMHETHGHQREAVEQIQDLNMNTLVKFFGNALHMPITNPADESAASSAAPAKKSL